MFSNVIHPESCWNQKYFSLYFFYNSENTFERISSSGQPQTIKINVLNLSTFKWDPKCYSSFDKFRAASGDTEHYQSRSFSTTFLKLWQALFYYLRVKSVAVFSESRLVWDPIWTWLKCCVSADPLPATVNVKLTESQEHCAHISVVASVVVLCVVRCICCFTSCQPDWLADWLCPI